MVAHYEGTRGSFYLTDLFIEEYNEDCVISKGGDTRDVSLRLIEVSVLLEFDVSVNNAR